MGFSIRNNTSSKIFINLDKPSYSLLLPIIVFFHVLSTVRVFSFIIYIYIVVGDIDVCIYIHIRICLNIKVMTMIILLYTQYYILYYYYLLMFIIVIHWLKWRIRTVIVTGDNTSPSIYVHTSLMLCRWTIALCSFLCGATDSNLFSNLVALHHGQLE